jgi:menaquinone-dependent protoporphyrinogen oxidase
MHVLIAVASKHGATKEIGEIIDNTLRAKGIQSTLELPENVIDLAPYDVVILGSGAYAGRWLKTARKFVEKHEKELLIMPVWLFSSGPLESPPYEKKEKFVVIDDIIEKIKPVEHHVFPGKLDPSKLNIGEKAIIKVVKAPYGDYRSQNDIIRWTAGVIDYLKDFHDS